jgi:hypothetical protein
MKPVVELRPTHPTWRCDCGHIKLNHEHEVDKLGNLPCGIIGCPCTNFDKYIEPHEPRQPVKTLDRNDPKLFDLREIVTQ